MERKKRLGGTMKPDSESSPAWMLDVEVRKKYLVSQINWKGSRKRGIILISVKSIGLMSGLINYWIGGKKLCSAHNIDRNIPNTFYKAPDVKIALLLSRKKSRITTRIKKLFNKETDWQSSGWGLEVVGWRIKWVVGGKNTWIAPGCLNSKGSVLRHAVNKMKRGHDFASSDVDIALQDIQAWYHRIE